MRTVSLGLDSCGAEHQGRGERRHGAAPRAASECWSRPTHLLQQRVHDNRVIRGNFAAKPREQVAAEVEHRAAKRVGAVVAREDGEEETIHGGGHVRPRSPWRVLHHRLAAQQIHVSSQCGTSAAAGGARRATGNAHRMPSSPVVSRLHSVLHMATICFTDTRATRVERLRRAAVRRRGVEARPWAVHAPPHAEAPHVVGAVLLDARQHSGRDSAARMRERRRGGAVRGRNPGGRPALGLGGRVHLLPGVQVRHDVRNRHVALILVPMDQLRGVAPRPRQCSDAAIQRPFAAAPPRRGGGPPRPRGRVPCPAVV